MAFTERERNAILERDDHTSQLRNYSERSGFKAHDGCIFDGRPCKNLQVHHIDTQRNGGGDTPDNGITLYECQHNGRCPENRIHGERYLDPRIDFIVHPDMVKTFKDYANGDSKAFQKMFETRLEAVANGEYYHNPDHDAEMFETAKERTLNALANGWVWPKRRK